MKEILVIDIGGTKTNISFVTSVNLEVKILTSEIFPTNSNPDLQVQKISSLYSEKSKTISNMSLSLPGLWDKNGILRESFNLKNWIGYPFIENLSNVIGIKDYTWETDVICGALGEYYMQNSESLLYLNIGTGVGAAFIKDGKPFRSNSNDMPRHASALRMQKLLVPEQGELTSAVDLICGSSILKDTSYNSVEKLYNDYKAGNIEAFEIISKSQLQLNYKMYL